MGFWDGSGIGQTICKHTQTVCWQITTPTPHQSIFTDWSCSWRSTNSVKALKATKSAVNQLLSNILVEVWHRHNLCTKSPHQYKAVIDRRLWPRCCHLESYCKRPKSSSVCALACNWYYCAKFTAKPRAACAQHFSWAVTSRNLGLWANMTSSIM